MEKQEKKKDPLILEVKGFLQVVNIQGSKEDSGALETLKASLARESSTTNTQSQAVPKAKSIISKQRDINPKNTATDQPKQAPEKAKQAPEKSSEQKLDIKPPAEENGNKAYVRRGTFTVEDSRSASVELDDGKVFMRLKSSLDDEELEKRWSELKEKEKGEEKVTHVYKREVPQKVSTKTSLIKRGSSVETKRVKNIELPKRPSLDTKSKEEQIPTKDDDHPFKDEILESESKSKGEKEKSDLEAKESKISKSSPKVTSILGKGTQETKVATSPINKQTEEVIEGDSQDKDTMRPTKITSKEAAKGTPKEAIKVAPKGAVKVASKEAAKVAPKEASKVSDQVVAEATSEKSVKQKSIEQDKNGTVGFTDSKKSSAPSPPIYKEAPKEETMQANVIKKVVTKKDDQMDAKYNSKGPESPLTGKEVAKSDEAVGLESQESKSSDSNIKDVELYKKKINTVKKVMPAKKLNVSEASLEKQQTRVVAKASSPLEARGKKVEEEGDDKSVPKVELEKDKTNESNNESAEIKLPDKNISIAKFPKAVNAMASAPATSKTPKTTAQKPSVLPMSKSPYVPSKVSDSATVASKTQDSETKSLEGEKEEINKVKKASGQLKEKDDKVKPVVPNKSTAVAKTAKTVVKKATVAKVAGIKTAISKANSNNTQIKVAEISDTKGSKAAKILESDIGTNKEKESLTPQIPSETYGDDHTGKSENEGKQLEEHKPEDVSKTAKTPRVLKAGAKAVTKAPMKVSLKSVASPKTAAKKASKAILKTPNSTLPKATKKLPLKAIKSPIMPKEESDSSTNRMEKSIGAKKKGKVASGKISNRLLKSERSPTLSMSSVSSEELISSVDKESIKTDKESIKTDKESIKTNKGSTKSDKGSVKADMEGIQKDKEGLKANKDIIEAGEASSVVSSNASDALSEQLNEPIKPSNITSLSENMLSIFPKKDETESVASQIISELREATASIEIEKLDPVIDLHDKESHAKLIEEMKETSGFSSKDLNKIYKKGSICTNWMQCCSGSAVLLEEASETSSYQDPIKISIDVAPMQEVEKLLEVEQQVCEEEGKVGAAVDDSLNEVNVGDKLTTKTYTFHYKSSEEVSDKKKEIEPHQSTLPIPLILPNSPFDNNVLHKALRHSLRQSFGLPKQKPRSKTKESEANRQLGVLTMPCPGLNFECCPDENLIVLLKSDNEIREDVRVREQWLAQEEEFRLSNLPPPPPPTQSMLLKTVQAAMSKRQSGAGLRTGYDPIDSFQDTSDDVKLRAYKGQTSFADYEPYGAFQNTENQQVYNGYYGDAQFYDNSGYDYNYDQQYNYNNDPQSNFNYDQSRHNYGQEICNNDQNDYNYYQDNHNYNQVNYNYDQSDYNYNQQNYNYNQQNYNYGQEGKYNYDFYGTQTYQDSSDNYKESQYANQYRQSAVIEGQNNYPLNYISSS